jgi:Putative MetA-pathway of phenol degradation
MIAKLATAIASVVLWQGLAAHRASAQALETETARVLPSGMLEGGAGIEVQGSSEGTESAAPLFVEVGIADRFEAVIEQVAFSAIRPTPGMSATGVGDLELTLVGLVLRENGSVPALAVAGEIKAPLAKNAQIGTGEFDYTGYLIASKRFGAADVHVNVGYSVLGAPPSVKVNNVFNYALAMTYAASSRLEPFAEIYGNTTSAATPINGGMVNPEFAGGEFVGVAGVSYRPKKWVKASLGVSLDNNLAVLVHPGLTFYHQLF